MTRVDPPLSDEQLLARTELLLRSAERVSTELRAQTELLATAIEAFEREILAPRRRVE